MELSCFCKRKWIEIALNDVIQIRVHSFGQSDMNVAACIHIDTPLLRVLSLNICQWTRKRDDVNIASVKTDEELHDYAGIL